MSGKQYLKNQLPVLLLNLLGILALALFLIATGTSRQAISFIALVWIVVVVCYLTVSFFIQKRHCETLLVMAEQLEEKYLMPEVMAMPERADEQVFYQILKMAEKSMLEKIGAISRKNMDRISSCAACCQENGCTVRLSDATVCKLPSEVWKQVVREGLKNMGYIGDQDIESIEMTMSKCGA